MDLSVELVGVPDVEASVAAVVDALQSPDLAEAAANLVAASAAPLVPVETGALARSQRVVRTSAGAALVYGAPYSVIVQARQPWLGASITAAVPRIVDLYGSQVVEAWEN